MNRNTELLRSFFESLKDHDHEAMARCYQPDASFKDIAFDLKGGKAIHAMWHMISESDLKLTYEIGDVSGDKGIARWRAYYTFRDTGRFVKNKLTSHFTFSDGLILTQLDDCNALTWGIRALGFVRGFGSWIMPKKREDRASEKLRNFISRHPRYGS